MRRGAVGEGAEDLSDAQEEEDGLADAEDEAEEEEESSATGSAFEDVAPRQHEQAAASMEQVFFRLHTKLIEFFTGVLGHRWLLFFECLAVVNALAYLVILVGLHATFVTQAPCVVEDLMAHLAEAGSPDILRIDVAGIWTRLKELDSDAAAAVEQAKGPAGEVLAPELYKVWLQDPTFMYSRERGFLLLSRQLREKHGITELNLTLSFDCVLPHLPGLVTFVLDNFVGYDTAVANTLIHSFDGGYMYSGLSRGLVDLTEMSPGQPDSDWWSAAVLRRQLGIAVITVFLFFITTTLVHHTLQETQSMMLQFTIDLQKQIEADKPYGYLVVNHVVNSLVFVPIMVGMLFFLFEFFNDQLLAFMVLAMVWASELFSAISLRTHRSIRLFPRLFFVYFLCFHVYLFSFPSGFSYLALTTSVALLQHLMVFLWRRFEVPAVENGTVTATHLRQFAPRSLESGIPPSLAYHALLGGSQGGHRLGVQNEGQNEQDEPVPRTPPYHSADGEQNIQPPRMSGSSSTRRRKRVTLHSSPSLMGEALGTIKPVDEILDM